MRAQLAAIDAGGEQIAELDRSWPRRARPMPPPRRSLSKQRHDAAARLDAAVAAELAPLKLDAARFRTAIAAAEPGPSGTDRVEFEVSTNPGAPFGPLTRIASGGELSRFILALKVALAEAGSAATMIFDEVDRGVGGAVASAIGERLARLAREVAGAGRDPLARRSRRAPRTITGSRRAMATDGTRTTVRKLDEANGAKRLRACSRARRSPRRRGPRRRACSTPHDGLCRAAPGREPARQDGTLKMADLKAIADELGLESARTYHRERQPALPQQQIRRGAQSDA